MIGPSKRNQTLRALWLAALVLMSAASSAQTVLERAARDELVFMRDEEPAMRKAFARAAATLDDFLAKARALSSQHSSFSLKVAVSQGDNTEYFWVNDFAEKADGSFEGAIGNEPRIVKTVKLGQRYAFPRERIVDWLYVDRAERRMVGNFTLCALLTKESRAEAEAVKQRFKLDCDWLVQ